MATEISVLDKGFVRLEAHMGSDLTVVNAARVSFAKRSTDVLACGQCEDCVVGGTYCQAPLIGEKDAKLIRYLARHEHWTPFGHCQVTLHYKMPIFVARQFMRSNVGIVYNEISRRYVDTPPEFYVPLKWRGRPSGSLKQGSAGEITPSFDCLMSNGATLKCGQGELPTLFLAGIYNQMVAEGVAPEMARMILPLNTYTEFWATMSLAAVARVCRLRVDPHAQWEIQEYARATCQFMYELFPVSFAALMNDQPETENYN